MPPLLTSPGTVKPHGWFAHTSSWVYKALHLALVVSASRDDAGMTHEAGATLLRVVCLVLLACFLPAILHAVPRREHTTSLLTQTILMLALMSVARNQLVARGMRAAGSLVAQLVTGHVFYALTAACLRDPELLVYSPTAVVIFGCVKSRKSTNRTEECDDDLKLRLL
jgi:hypothetical protein